MAEERIIKIFIDDGSLEKVLEKDRKLVEKLDRQLADLKEGSVQWNKVTADREKILQRITQAEAQMAGKLGPTLQQLRQKQKALNDELSKMPIELRASSEAAKHLKVVNAELEKVRLQSGAVGGGMRTMVMNMKSLAGGIGAFSLIQSGISMVFNAFRDAVRSQKEFQLALSNLRAITGASKEDLKFYAEAAKDVAKEHGVMARDVVEAYKLIGSAKPELLANKRALAEVTEQAVVLSKASGLDLPEASRRLVAALNQFNAPASDAGRYINILAEAAKLGNAEVPELTDAIEKSGAAARVANVKFAENAAILEVFAEKELKGSEAGTQLRNVLLNMSTAEALPQKAIDALEEAGVNIQKLSDTTLPFKDRLAELSKIQGNATAIAEVFGKENFTAASILIDGRARVEELSLALGKDGLATAYEQAEINTDNLAGSVDKLGGQWDAIMQGEGDLGRFFKAIVDGASQALVYIDNLGLAWRMFYTDVEDLGQKDLSALLKIGELENGQKMSSFLKPFDALKDIDFMKSAEKLKTQFVDELVAAGEKAEVAGALFDQYARERTQAMIDDHKSRQNTVATTTEKEVGAEKTVTENNIKEQKRRAEEREKAAKREREERERDIEKYTEDLKKLNEQVASSQLEGKEKEIFELQLAYARRIDEAKRLNQDLVILEELKAKELAIIEDKYLKIQTEKQKQEDAKIADEKAKEKEKRLAEEASVEAQLLDMKRQAEGDELAMLNDKYAQMALKAHDNQVLLAEIEKQRIDAVTDYEKEKRREMNEFLLAQGEEVYGILQEFVANRRRQDQEEAMTAQQEKSQREMQELDLAMQQELQKKNISEAQKGKIETDYANKKRKLEEKHQEEEKQLKLEAWEADKRASLLQAVIAGALAVVKALPNWPNAIAAGIVAAAQVSVIAAQKPPKFELGGVSKGARHSGGGISMIDSASGMKVGEMEGGEPYMILSRNTYANNRAVIDSLLHSSMNRGGAPIDFPRFGKQPRLDFSKVVSASRPMFAEGGVMLPQKVTPGSGSTGPQTSDNQLAAILEELTISINMNTRTLMAVQQQLQQPLVAPVFIGNRQAEDLRELDAENAQIDTGGAV